MIKREVLMPEDLINQISTIVEDEGYEVLMKAFPKDQRPPIFLSKDEADALITLVVIEKKKASLKYPYYDDEHPLFNKEHEEKFDDIQMGIYEKTIYYTESVFKKGEFDHLL